MLETMHSTVFPYVEEGKGYQILMLDHKISL